MTFLQAEKDLYFDFDMKIFLLYMFDKNIICNSQKSAVFRNSCKNFDFMLDDRFVFVLRCLYRQGENKLNRQKSEENRKSGENHKKQKI